MRFDSTQLIAAVKRKVSIPSTQSLFTNEDFIELADEALHSIIVPLIQSVVEEYFVHVEDFTVTPTNNFIEIPTEASGLRLREIYEIDQMGGSIISSVRRVALDTLANSVFGYRGGYSSQSCFYLQNSQVMFYPLPTAAHYFRVLFYKSPNHLVQVIAGGTVTAITPASNTITLNSSPNWDIGNKLDVMIPQVPFNLRKEDVTIVSKAGFDIVLSAADFASIAVGDLVYLAGEAPVAQYIPAEAWFLLVQATSMRCLESLADANALKASYATFNEMKKNLLTLINPRIVGDVKKVSKRVW